MRVTGYDPNDPIAVAAVAEYSGTDTSDRTYIDPPNSGTVGSKDYLVLVPCYGFNTVTTEWSTPTNYTQGFTTQNFHALYYRTITGTSDATDR